MKRFLFIIAAAACMTVACKKEENKALSPDKQKSYIQDVCVEAIELIDIDNWKPQANVIKGSVATFDNVKPDKSVDNWLASIEPKDGDEVRLSSITGAFSVSNGNLTYTASDALTLDYSINEVLPCTAKVVIEDSETKLALALDDSDASGSEPKEKHILLYIPSSITFNVISGEEEGFRLKLGTDIKLAGNEPTPYDSYGITAKVVSGDYSINLTRAYYSPTEIAWASDFSKGNTVIFRGSIKAEGELVWDEENGDYEPSFKKSSGEAEIEFSLLDKVGISGRVSLDKIKSTIAEYGEPASENEAKKYVKDLEKCFNLSLTCDGDKQAKLGLELDEKEGIIPVIRFEDGSKYQLPEEYFNEDSFGSVISALESLIGKINSVFDDEEAGA